MATELKTTFDKLDFALHGIVVPPIRVGSGRYKANDRSALTEARPCLRHPFPYLAPIGRVHPTDALPRPHKRVFLLSVEARAFGVFSRRANVEREPIASVIPVKKRLRRFPQIGLAAEMNVHQHLVAPGVKYIIPLFLVAISRDLRRAVRG